MATAAELQSYRDALVKAVGSGTLTVEAGGVKRTFRSVGELRSAIATIDAELRTAGGTQRVSMIRISSSKGLD